MKLSGICSLICWKAPRQPQTQDRLRRCRLPWKRPCIYAYSGVSSHTSVHWSATITWRTVRNSWRFSRRSILWLLRRKTPAGIAPCLRAALMITEGGKQPNQTDVCSPQKLSLLLQISGPSWKLVHDRSGLESLRLGARSFGYRSTFLFLRATPVTGGFVQVGKRWQWEKLP